MSSDSNNLVRTMCCCLSVTVVWIVSVNELLAVKIPKKTPQNIDDALRRHGIVPHLVEESPKHAVEVAYGNNVVDFGNNFTESDIENDPTHVNWPADKDSLYTLILTGPDVPTYENPEDKECQHWIVTNIPGTDIASGYNLTEYKGILTFYEYGTHRLIFLVYKQPTKEPIQFKEERKEKSIVGYMRAFFHFEIFAIKYQLGAPIAINFLMVQINQHSNKLSSVASAQVGVNDKFRNPPLTSDGILSQIFHQYFR